MMHIVQKLLVILRIMAIGMTPGTRNPVGAMNPRNPLTWILLFVLVPCCLLWHGLQNVSTLISEIREALDYNEYRDVRARLADGRLLPFKP